MVYNVTCTHGAGPCLRKPAQYIGKVGPTRACRVRCTEHRGAVNHHWDTGVGEHFNLPGHDLADFNFLPFEKVRSGDPFVVETRESLLDSEIWSSGRRRNEQEELRKKHQGDDVHTHHPSTECN